LALPFVSIVSIQTTREALGSSGQAQIQSFMHSTAVGSPSTPQVELASKHNLGSLSYAEAFEERNIAWCSFLKPGLDRNERRYEEVSDWSKVQKLLRDYLEDYNSSHTNSLDLVFFQAAVDHVCRLCRVLQQVCCESVCMLEAVCIVCQLTPACLLGLL
jgi:hypothetical protein